MRGAGLQGVTIAQVISVVIYIGTMLGALTAIGAFFHFVIVRPVRKFLRREIVTNLVDISSSLTRLEGRLMEHVSDPKAHPSNGEE